MCMQALNLCEGEILEEAIMHVSVMQSCQSLHLHVRGINFYYCILLHTSATVNVDVCRVCKFACWQIQWKAHPELSINTDVTQQLQHSAYCQVKFLKLNYNSAVFIHVMTKVCNWPGDWDDLKWVCQQIVYTNTLCFICHKSWSKSVDYLYVRP